MAIDELTRHSVRRDEIEAATGVAALWFNQLNIEPLVPLSSDPPPYWSLDRDIALRRAVRYDGLWSDAINIACTRIASMGYELDGDGKNNVSKARKLVGFDWVNLMSKLARDFATQDNGAHLEIVRANNSVGGKVLGYQYLSSLRCMRTSDITRPIVYMDRLGQQHWLEAHQVVSFADSPDDDYDGIGYCATSRAWEDIYTHIAVSRYFKEKASGRRVLAIDLIKGISQDKIDSLLKTAQFSAQEKGLLSFMGTALLASANSENKFEHLRIPFVDLPDWFNLNEYTELTQINYAAHIGIDATELNPRLIGNRQLGAGSQAKVLDDKQDSKGLISFRQQFTQFANDTDRWHPLPGRVTFAFSERDLVDQKARADISLTRAQVSAARIAAAITTAQQEVQVLIDAGDLPDSFLVTPIDNQESLTDEDKANSVTQTAQSSASADPSQANAASAVSNAVNAVASQTATAAKSLALKEGNTGAMIALMYNPQSALDMVNQYQSSGLVYDPTPVGEMHVALVYLGKAADNATIKDALMRALDVATRGVGAINTVVTGYGRFAPGDEGLTPMVALIDSPQLPALRASMYQAASGAGWSCPDLTNEHGFIPHATLDYIPAEAPTPVMRGDPIKTSFDTLSLVWGGERIDYPLGVSPVLKATNLATVSLVKSGRPRKDSEAYYKELTSGLTEIGRIWTLAAREHVPQDQGETNRSIRFVVSNKNTPQVTLKMLCGNSARPDVAIRATLYGRKGFGPKKASVLRFYVGGKTVFAHKVKGVLSNDWFSRSWDQVQPHLKELEARLKAKVKSDLIDVTDIPGAKRYTRASQIQSPKKKK
jgi:hypothetical protein